MEESISEVLRGAANEAVFEHLSDLSAHSDVAAALEDAMAPLGDVQTFSPTRPGRALHWARHRDRSSWSTSRTDPLDATRGSRRGSRNPTSRW